MPSRRSSSRPIIDHRREAFEDLTGESASTVFGPRSSMRRPSSPPQSASTHSRIHGSSTSRSRSQAYPSSSAYSDTIYPEDSVSNVHTRSRRPSHTHELRHMPRDSTRRSVAHRYHEYRPDFDDELSDHMNRTRISDLNDDDDDVKSYRSRSQYHTLPHSTSRYETPPPAYVSQEPYVASSRHSSSHHHSSRSHHTVDDPYEYDDEPLPRINSVPLGNGLKVARRDDGRLQWERSRGGQGARKSSKGPVPKWLLWTAGGY